MGISRNLTINVSHDEQEGVWHVLSSDLPGLNAEAATLDELVAVIADLAPDLIAANLPDLVASDPAGVELSIQHNVSIKQAHAA